METLMDKFLSACITIIGISFFLLGMIYGEFSESKRIYNKCMETNSIMIYADVKDKCKGIVK
jgi:hypothetical protein